MSLMQDLKFIEVAVEMTTDAMINNDEKRAVACIRSIQNYLNSTRHPLAFFSIAVILAGSKN